MAKKPIAKFVVGDFIVSRTFEFPLKITKLASGDGQIETIKADGYNDKDIYNIFPDGDATLFYQIPQFKVGDRIIYPTTQNGTWLGGGAKTLIEKATDEKLGYLVVTNVTYNRYLDEEFNYWLGFQKLPNASVSFNDEDNLKLYEANPEKPETKFKVGDKVKFPKDKAGVEISNLVIYDAKSDGKNYLIIGRIDKNKFTLISENSAYDLVQYDSGQIELYEETERPEQKFKIGDQVKYDKMPFVTFTVDNITGFNYKRQTWVYRLNNNDKKSSWSAGYEPELKLIVDDTPIDCEAEPSLIVSGQVKKFYDLNKLRIEKLKSEFSCKIIKALVSLSDYEKCGTPSKIKLPIAKEDLLSEIKNLKF